MMRTVFPTEWEQIARCPRRFFAERGEPTEPAMAGTVFHAYAKAYFDHLIQYGLRRDPEEGVELISVLAEQPEWEHLDERWRDEVGSWVRLLLKKFALPPMENEGGLWVRNAYTEIEIFIGAEGYQAKRDGAIAGMRLDLVIELVTGQSPRKCDLLYIDLKTGEEQLAEGGDLDNPGKVPQVRDTSMPHDLQLRWGVMGLAARWEKVKSIKAAHYYARTGQYIETSWIPLIKAEAALVDSYDGGEMDKANRQWNELMDRHEDPELEDAERPNDTCDSCPLGAAGSMDCGWIRDQSQAANDFAAGRPYTPEEEPADDGFDPGPWRDAHTEEEWLWIRLRDALHSTGGAEERWAQSVESGLDDAALTAVIGYEFGINGGSSGPQQIPISYAGGQKPRFWFDCSATAKPTLAGAKLRDLVREIMQVPYPKEETDDDGVESPATAGGDERGHAGRPDGEVLHDDESAGEAGDHVQPAEDPGQDPAAREDRREVVGQRSGLSESAKSFDPPAEGVKKTRKKKGDESFVDHRAPAVLRDLVSKASRQEPLTDEDRDFVYCGWPAEKNVESGLQVIRNEVGAKSIVRDWSHPNDRTGKSVEFRAVSSSGGGWIVYYIPGIRRLPFWIDGAKGRLTKFVETYRHVLFEEAEDHEKAEAAVEILSGVHRGEIYPHVNWLQLTWHSDPMKLPPLIHATFARAFVEHLAAYEIELVGQEGDDSDGCVEYVPANLMSTRHLSESLKHVADPKTVLACISWCQLQGMTVKARKPGSRLQFRLFGATADDEQADSDALAGELGLKTKASHEATGEYARAGRAESDPYRETAEAPAQIPSAVQRQTEDESTPEPEPAPAEAQPPAPVSPPASPPQETTVTDDTPKLTIALEAVHKIKEHDQYWKILLGGPYKTFKTRNVLAAFCEAAETDVKRALVIDVEDGTRWYGDEWAFLRPMEKGWHHSDPSRKRVPTSPDTIMKLLTQFINNLPPGVDTLVLDSITVILQKLEMYWVNVFMNRDLSSPGHKGEFIKLQPDQRAVINRNVREVYDMLRAASHNVILIAHVEPNYVTSGRMFEQVGERIAAGKDSAYEFDTVIQLERDPMTREIWARTTGDRSNRLPEANGLKRWKWTQRALKNAIGGRGVEVEVVSASTDTELETPAANPEPELPTVEPTVEPLESNDYATAPAGVNSERTVEVDEKSPPQEISPQEPAKRKTVATDDNGSVSPLPFDPFAWEKELKAQGVVKKLIDAFDGESETAQTELPIEEWLSLPDGAKSGADHPELYEKPGGITDQQLKMVVMWKRKQFAAYDNAVQAEKVRSVVRKVTGDMTYDTVKQLTEQQARYVIKYLQMMPF